MIEGTGCCDRVIVCHGFRAKKNDQLGLLTLFEYLRAKLALWGIHADLSGDLRVLEPPDSIPNSEVKRYIADGSVGFPHVRVGHRQAFEYRRLADSDPGDLQVNTIV